MTITDPAFLTRAFRSGAFAHTTPPMPPMVDPALPGVGDPGKPPIGDPPGRPLEPDDPGQPVPRPEPPSTPIAPPGIPLPPAITSGRRRAAPAGREAGPVGPCECRRRPAAAAGNPG